MPAALLAGRWPRRPRDHGGVSMRTLLRSGLLWPCCLVACSTPLTAPNPGAAPTGGAVYRLDWIAGPDGVPGAAALDINDRGEIAGASTGGDAFTWSAQTG